MFVDSIFLCIFLVLRLQSNNKRQMSLSLVIYNILWHQLLSSCFHHLLPRLVLGRPRGWGIRRHSNLTCHFGLGYLTASSHRCGGFHYCLTGRMLGALRYLWILCHTQVACYLLLVHRLLRHCFLESWFGVMNYSLQSCVWNFETRALIESDPDHDCSTVKHKTTSPRLYKQASPHFPLLFTSLVGGTIKVGNFLAKCRIASSFLTLTSFSSI